MYFIDTNIFLRSIVKEDESAYEDCKNLILDLEENKLQAKTSHLVLSEVVWVLKSFYDFTKEEIVVATQNIPSLEGLSFSENFNRDIAIQIFKKNNIKFIDAMIVSHSKILDKEMKIISYDQDFNQLDVERVEPRSLLDD